MKGFMLRKETLEKIVASQKEELHFSNDLISREILTEMNLSAKQAVIVSGIRRCGKSSLLKLLMTKLNNFHYFNFEDSRLVNFDVTDFERLYEIQNTENPDCSFYFFDEIQNIDSWERFVRTLLDRNKKVFITGSNASLLSYELGTKLTGRHLRYELFPFSYTEMLALLNKEKNPDSCMDYLQYGGFPEFLLHRDIRILQELLKDILYRDIFVRHRIRNTHTFRNLILSLISNTGKIFSYNNLKKNFQLGSVNTVISFLSYLEDSYLLFTIPKFDYSYNKQVANPKKIYAIDTGLVRANSVSFSKDIGRTLENCVFLKLKRIYNEVFYFKEKHECDFVVKNNEKITLAIQVCYKITEENEAREMNGIVEAVKKFDLHKGIIITYNQEDTLNITDKEIDIIPAWKWL